MNFKINSNGNPADHFKIAYVGAQKAHASLEDSLQVMQGLIHGRNYQTCADPEKAWEEDHVVLHRCQHKLAEIETVLSDFALTVAKQLEK